MVWVAVKSVSLNRFVSCYLKTNKFLKVCIRPLANSVGPMYLTKRVFNGVRQQSAVQSATYHRCRAYIFPVVKNVPIGVSAHAQ